MASFDKRKPKKRVLFLRGTSLYYKIFTWRIQPQWNSINLTQAYLNSTSTRQINSNLFGLPLAKVLERADNQGVAVPMLVVQCIEWLKVQEGIATLEYSFL